MSSPEIDARLDELAGWVARAGVAAGLTNYGTAEAVRSQAIAPALVIADRIATQDARVVEIGSGSGALGLALALLMPSAMVYLVDSSARSAVFVEMTARRLRVLNAISHRLRLPVADWRVLGGPFDVVVLRAFAPGVIAVATAASLCRPCGRIMWLHSADDATASHVQGNAVPVSSRPSGVENMLLSEFAVGCASAEDKP